MNPWESESSAIINASGFAKVENKLSSWADDLISSLDAWKQMNAKNNHLRLLNSQVELKEENKRILATITNERLPLIDLLSSCLHTVSELSVLVNDLLAPSQTAFIYIEAAQHRSFRAVLEECAHLLSNFNNFWSLASNWSDVEATLGFLNRILSKLALVKLKFQAVAENLLISLNNQIGKKQRDH